MRTKEKVRSSITTASWRAVLLVPALLGAAFAARAQSFRGAIVGTVMDKSEAPVPGAQVTAKNPATGLVRATTTDDSGNYQSAHTYGHSSKRQLRRRTTSVAITI